MGDLESNVKVSGIYTVHVLVNLYTDYKLCHFLFVFLEDTSCCN